MNGDLDSFALATGLIGGLALFLFGMDILTRGLKHVAGAYMKSILERMTRNRLLGMATGAAVTATLQSSSITTVLLVGFISAGLVTLTQSIPVIIGANIGTTITAQILAFKVTKFALPLLAAGFFVSFLAKNEKWRQYGRITLGLGMVFFGMVVMSDAMEPLRSYRPFIIFMASLDNPLLAASIGAIFTAVIQSSSATTGILIVMASQGLIGLEAAIALALGANIGTCVTAGLASIGRPTEAVRLAFIHTLFNVVGVLIWIGFVDELAALARNVSPIHPELFGLARTSAELPRQLANIHTFFNVINAVLFIGFTPHLARMAEQLIADRPEPGDARAEPVFLDPQLLVTTDLALDAARRELGHLGTLTRDMLDAVSPVAISGSQLELDQLKVMDRPVDLLHRSIIGYLRKVSLANLSSDQSEMLMAYIRIANELEQIGDRISTGIVISASKRLDENVVISKVTAAAISHLHARVVKALDTALLALEAEDRAGAEAVRAMKKDMADAMQEIARHEISRLRADEPKRLLTYTREIELIESLEAVFNITRSIAKTQISVFDRAKADTAPEKTAV